MHNLCRLFLFALLPCLPVVAQDPVHSSTVTFSAGGNVDSYNHFGEGGGPSFAGAYEYRLWRYFGLEAGVNAILPTKQGFEFPAIFSITSQGTATSFFTGTQPINTVAIPVQTRTVVTMLPFGIRGILPLAQGKLELFAGFGGAYEFNGGVHALNGRGDDANGMLGQASAGARYALDHRRHYWVGTTVRGYSNASYGKQSWVTWTADFAIRFGH